MNIRLLMLPLITFFLFATSNVYAGAEKKCDLQIKNCTCSTQGSTLKIATYHGNDGSHIASYSTRDIMYGFTENVSCKHDNCDVKFTMGNSSFWKNDFCGGLTVKGIANTTAGIQACNACP